MKHSLKHIISDIISAFEDTIKILEDPTLSAEELYDMICKENTQTGACLYIEITYGTIARKIFQKHMQTCGYLPHLYFPLQTETILKALKTSPTNAFNTKAIALTKQRLEFLKLLKIKIPWYQPIIDILNTTKYIKAWIYKNIYKK